MSLVGVLNLMKTHIETKNDVIRHGAYALCILCYAQEKCIHRLQELGALTLFRDFMIHASCRGTPAIFYLQNILEIIQ